MKLCNLTNLREPIINISIPFQTYSPKWPNKEFLVPNLLFFVLKKFLNFGKFKDTDFSNITIIFQIFEPKYPNKAFLVPFFVVAVIVVVLLDF